MAERINIGASNATLIDTLKKYLAGFKGPGWDALVSAIAAGDEAVQENNRLAFDQLFKCTASGKYLYERAADVGVYQPNGVGMSDPLFREYAIKKTASQLTPNSIGAMLEIFYTADACRANLTSEKAEPFALADGDTLNVAVDGEAHTIVFNSKHFKNIAQAGALEIAAVINRTFQIAGSKAYATGAKKIAIYSGAIGLAGSIAVTGGKAQNVLLFPTQIPTYLTAFSSSRWDVSVPSPGLAKYTAVPRANLLTYSQQVDNAAWTKSECTISADATTAPDGSSTADKIVESTANAIHRISWTTVLSSVLLGSTTYTFSVYAKASGRQYLYFNCSTANAKATFDLVNGTALTGTGTAQIVSVGNGWWRCSITGTTPATVIDNWMYLQLNNTYTVPDTTYAGDGASGIYVWGAQIERGEAVTGYIPTTTVSVADQLTIPAGLINAVPGDYANIYAATFATGNQGSFEITDVFVDYPGPKVNFTVKSPNAIAQNSVVQSSVTDVQIFRPTRATIGTLARAAYVTQFSDSGFALNLPVTTQVVNRTKNTGAYAQANSEITISTVSRAATGVITVVTSAAHGLTVGDQIIIDAVRPSASPNPARFNDIYAVAGVVDGTTFTVKSSLLSTASGTGGKITTFKAASATVPGPYILNPEEGFAVTGTEAALSSDYSKYVSYSQLNVSSTVVFPNAPGWLVLGFGTKYEMGPIAYYGIIDATRLNIDPSFKFTKTIPTGTKVTLLANKAPWAPAHPEEIGAFYATASDSGLTAAIQTIKEISASGTDITKNIVYPGDRGLGGEGKETSDKTKIWGG